MSIVIQIWASFMKRVHGQIFERGIFVGLYKAGVNRKPEPRTKDCLRRTGLGNIYQVSQLFQLIFIVTWRIAHVWVANSDI